MKYIILLIVIHCSWAEAPYAINYFIVWNVGQGQWTTWVRNDSCSHFDFGGELTHSNQLLKKIERVCRFKNNYLYLSHADWDHYSFLPQIVKRFKSVCWKIKPNQNLKFDFKTEYCSESPDQPIIRILYTDHLSTEKNAISTVVQIPHILIPGDSPIKAEKKWIHSLGASANVKLLILGHHGSRTSTSQELINALPRLRMTIASQRTKKYGHPHREVAVKLFNRGLRIIKTEDWGHILIQNP